MNKDQPCKNARTNLLYWPLLLLFFWAFSMQSLAQSNQSQNDRYPLSEPAQQAQFDRLSGKLRCLVCQNQSLADSSADLAGDLRGILYQKVQANESDAAIIDFFVTRYGEFVLYDPPVNAKNGLLWFLPLFLMLLGAGIWWRLGKR